MHTNTLEKINSRDILIPLEYFEKHNVYLRDLVEKKKSKELEDLVFDMATRANANVTKVLFFRVQTFINTSKGTFNAISNHPQSASNFPPIDSS